MNSDSVSSSSDSRVDSDGSLCTLSKLSSFVFNVALVVQIPAWVLTWISNPDKSSTLAFCWPAWSTGLAVILWTGHRCYKKGGQALCSYVGFSLATTLFSFSRYCGGGDIKNALAFAQAILWLIVFLLATFYDIIESFIAAQTAERTELEVPLNPKSVEDRLDKLHRMHDRLTPQEYRAKVLEIMQDHAKVLKMINDPDGVDEVERPNLEGRFDKLHRMQDYLTPQEYREKVLEIMNDRNHDEADIAIV
mmetsp:Transcript_37016/g.45256  ORF Transcript_37016/g.45256 Transcript_37016/m.45256 type:complete len:249 (-) Transcript_37016:94-840(-)|eukprot:CAMPEP_0172503952 /NCGR_PEP_ID=MMETSP1066-20121228/174083_1 /TAXON_ID=671091 /ORGANISM="Coscinodiscus wailesii, Strain CCMP2513" /LENGTH=248 /DNA_ID=CAMNT_0013279911 /DNA_START=104 /DNA_END=850 /DNA_ORIENTATION=-